MCSRFFLSLTRLLYSFCLMVIVLVTSSVCSSVCAFAAHTDEHTDEAAMAVSLDAAYGKIAEDDFASMTLKWGLRLLLPRLGCVVKGSVQKNICLVPLHMDVQLPLRFRLRDQPPIEGNLLRLEDWDERTDWLRVIRLVSYGDNLGPVFVHLGTLGPLSLGHGTIVADYFNMLSPDQHQLGARMRLGGDDAQVHAFVDNIVAPSVLGAHASVRPGTWFVEDPGYVARLALGAQLVHDLNAPVVLATPSVAEGVERLPALEKSVHSVWWGIDLEFWLAITDWIDVGTYVDAAVHMEVGQGLHIGVQTSWSLVDVLEVTLDAEYVLTKGGYMPQSIGSLYEVERFEFQGFGAARKAPKRSVAGVLDAQMESSGLRAKVGVEIPRVHTTLSARYGTYTQEQSDTLLIFLKTQPVDALQLAVFYARNAFDTHKGVLRLDDALLASALRVDLTEVFYAVGRLEQQWKMNARGAFLPSLNWHVGVGVNLAWAL